MMNAIEIVLINTKEDFDESLEEELSVKDYNAYINNKEGDEPLCLLTTKELENEESKEEINYYGITVICSSKNINITIIFNAIWKARILLKEILIDIKKPDIFEVSIDNLYNIDPNISLLSIKFIMDSMLYDLVQ